MSKGKTILARVLTGTCVGCNVFPLFGRATGGEGEENESGPGTGVAIGVVSFPRGELTGTVKPSPHTPSHFHFHMKPSIFIGLHHVCPLRG